MPLTFGLITPSYAPDFRRCQLLAWSIAQYVQPPFTHYIVVDRRDYAQFATLANARTQILTVEAIVPRWIWREPLWRKVWLSAKTLPIRNWILQQMVKLIVAQQIAEDVAVFVDSDVTFVRPFDLNYLARSTQVRLYRDDVGNDVQRDCHRPWHGTAARLLGLPLGLPLAGWLVPDYIGNLITWRKSNVALLCAQLEQVSGRSWIETLAREWHWSEYILYGMYVDVMLGDRAEVYPIDHNLCHDYWFPKLLDDRALQQWIAQLEADQVAVMISAKSGIPVERYAGLLCPDFN
jgi:Family of unknown function (DUF6492)